MEIILWVPLSLMSYLFSAPSIFDHIRSFDSDASPRSLYVEPCPERVPLHHLARPGFRKVVVKGSNDLCFWAIWCIADRIGRLVGEEAVGLIFPQGLPPWSEAMPPLEALPYIPMQPAQIASTDFACQVDIMPVTEVLVMDSSCQANIRPAKIDFQCQVDPADFEPTTPAPTLQMMTPAAPALIAQPESVGSSLGTTGTIPDHTPSGRPYSRWSPRLTAKFLVMWRHFLFFMHYSGLNTEAPLTWTKPRAEKPIPTLFWDYWYTACDATNDALAEDYEQFSMVHDGAEQFMCCFPAVPAATGRLTHYNSIHDTLAMPFWKIAALRNRLKRCSDIDISHHGFDIVKAFEVLNWDPSWLRLFLIEFPGCNMPEFDIADRVDKAIYDHLQNEDSDYEEDSLVCFTRSKRRRSEE